jgi:hypothetical protein
MCPISYDNRSLHVMERYRAKFGPLSAGSATLGMLSSPIDTDPMLAATIQGDLVKSSWQAVVTYLADNDEIVNAKAGMTGNNGGQRAHCTG